MARHFQGPRPVGGCANLANALALQAVDRPTAPAASKKGFKAFPATTQQIILFASERAEDGRGRSEPVESYTEVLGLANTAYVAQHLHHQLSTRLGLDVWLPVGFCLAVRLAAFVALPETGRTFLAFLRSGRSRLASPTQRHRKVKAIPRIRSCGCS